VSFSFRFRTKAWKHTRSRRSSTRQERLAGVRDAGRVRGSLPGFESDSAVAVLEIRRVASLMIGRSRLASRRDLWGGRGATYTPMKRTRWAS